MSNSFGTLFQITSWGESHGKSIGVVIDGCPPQLPISSEEIQHELNRRKPGQSSLTTPRIENDIVEIHSGVYQGKTLGTPICLIVHNKDQKPEDYHEISTKFRPSHADFTYQKKFGIRNPLGGGRSSARETIARVASATIAKKILKLAFNIEIRAFIQSLNNIITPPFTEFPSEATIEATPVRCPHPETALKMIQLIEEVKSQGDSIGGIIQCRIQNTPIGLGAPVFDKLEASLAHAMLSIPATKGFEIGSGFQGTTLKGSEHNDPFKVIDNQIITTSNHSGGIQGGISNGQEIYFNVAFKPTATINKKQSTVTNNNENTTLEAKGRHDPCVLPRAVPIVEAMTALVLVDHVLIHSAQNLTFNF